jgi:cytochrome c oxidase assembly protein subunit 11
MGAEKSNTRLALKLAGIAVAMFGFGYALVPLYNVFCDITGLNGKTGRVRAENVSAEDIDPDRIITVEFDTNINGDLPWEFKSRQWQVQVHPGEIGEAFFTAENTADFSIVGQAIPSVAPAEASIYFNKTECFCFSQQTLAGGERRDMPVRFVVDPALPGDIEELTLSYTFFKAPDQKLEARAEPADKKQRKQFVTRKRG